MTEIIRCFGNGEGKEYLATYHDQEWGVPSYDDRHLFELLILEGAQAGLSWGIILKKRAGYKQLFYDFDAAKIAAMTDNELDGILRNPMVIRNKLKIYSVRKNARIFLSIAGEFGSFSNYLWRFVNQQPIQNSWQTWEQVPTSTPLSDKISKDMKKRGMSFVGTTIIYSYLQAVGLINDHLVRCPWRKPRC